MTTVIIRIKWSKHSTEYVSLDTDNPPKKGSAICTTELWTETREHVDYETICEQYAVKGSIHEFRLRYESSNNPLPDEKSAKISWGYSDILVDTLKLTGAATWTGDADSLSNGTGRCTVNLMGGDLLQEIGYESFLRIARPEQARLREYLLAKDKCCAISGEDTHEVIDAAHIYEAQDGGVSAADNSFLLRADLHRLFDARLLSIDLNGKIRFAESVSANYRKAFVDKEIPEAVLKRITSALQLRTARLTESTEKESPTCQPPLAPSP